MSSNFTEKQAREIVQEIISNTKYHAIIQINDNGEKLTRFANSEIHQNVEIDNIQLNLTLIDGKKSAFSKTNVFDTDSLKKFVADAEEILSNTPDGESEYQPRPNQGEIPRAVNDTRLAEKFDINGRAEAVKKCINSLSQDYTTAGVISLKNHMQVFGDSGGAFLYNDFDSIDFSAVVTHKDGATGYGEIMTNCLDNCDIDGKFKIAYDKAKASINPIHADLGAYTVVLEPAALGNLLFFLLYGLGGGYVQKGTSYAAGNIGEKLFGENVTIFDDISNLATFQRPFDSEGYRRKTIPLIEKGVLKNVLHCTKTAQKASVLPTGHSLGTTGEGGLPLNVVMTGGDSSLPEMIAGVKKGILVTHFHYCNFVNPKTAQLTGLTRDGTFMIEDGKITNPLCNMRFTEGLMNAFSNITALSKELTPVSSFGGPAYVPAATIENFHFTSGQK